MGGKSGGGQHVPYEAPNSLSSAQSLKIIDVVSEGEIAGFANGQDAPFKSVFLNDTVVQNADGSFNFKGITGFFQRGTPDQSYVPGFDASERTVSVSAAVKHSTPVVRSVSDPLVSRLRVTVGVERNARVADNGDTLAADTSLTVTLAGKSGSVSQQVRFTEKGSGAYYQDAVFDKLPSVPFTVRVARNTPDSTSDKVSNNTFFASFVEIVDAKLCYPHTAFAALHIDSDQFGSSVPRRNFLIRGLLLQVPSNYDPETRSYAGIWDGSFKTAWTNNPAWVFYDLLTRPRYSTLARRLLPGQIDKWALYEIGRYCDDLVPDGFGGREPRYVCNAYITDMKQAGELLQTLCSVFCGLPLWTGERLSVVADLDADPIALYTNANVLDGQFSYGSAALKSIHTAVQVQYLDKNDSYRAKTEYVADDEAVARYGLNIKQVTAFGCDSRGQAVRFAQWTLQTELRQQNTVTFTVGREGLKHLPWDIVQVMDNDYAGAELSGRLKAVSGDTATLDRPVKNAVGSMLRLPSADGIVSAKVTAQPAPDTLVLDAAPAVAEGDVWILSGRVKPRLFRCVGIKENTEGGTYTVTALLHDPAKYAAVDTSADFSREVHSLRRADPLLANPSLHAGGGKVTLTWDNLTADGQVLSYDIKIYRDGKLYRHIPDVASAEIVLHGLPKGSYRAEIRGRNARGVYSEPLVKAWTLDYEISAVRTVGKTLAVDLVWTWPQTVADELAVEIRYGRTADLSKAQKLAELPYPQNTYTLTGVGAADEFWFWLRVRDAAGNTGEFTAPVRGTSDPNPAPLVKLIEKQITESSLSQSLKDLLDGKIEAGKNAAVAEAGKKTAAEAAERSRAVAAEAEARKKAFAAEASARMKALADEADARRQAMEGEAAARSRDIQTASKKAADDLAAKARELGTKITSVETVNNSQAQQIQTVTAAQGKTAAGLEREIKARADGISAEAQKRETMAAKLDGQIAGITREQSVLAEKDKTRAAETAALTTRMGQAEGGLTKLRESVVQADRARVQSVDSLTARLDGLKVGGRNLLKQSAPDVDYGYLARFALAEAPAVGEDVTVTLWGEIGSDRTSIGVYNSRGFGMLFGLTKVADGLWRGTGKWGLATGGNNAGDQADNTHLNVYFFPNSGASQSHVSRIKLERGTLGTDWTPAPEDGAAAAETVAAELAAHKSAQAQKDSATAEELKTAKAQVAGNMAQITALKTAKADKTEVASIAQTVLESKWLSAADKAKVAAVKAAAQTAQDKADTAKEEALTAADRAAQAKADAAKKAAVAAASKDAADKADAAKAQAIADAAAKDAVVKQQAADDAKAKADKALADAKAYADGLNAASEAKISRLEQTSVTRQQAEAIAQSTVSAKFQVPDTRNDNQPPSWYWENYPRQTVTEFKKSSVIGLRGGVGSNAFCAMETRVPFANPTGGEVFQTASLSDGTVWRRKSDVVYTLETRTYSRDAWTDWVQDETVDGAQAKADAVKKIAEAAKTLAERTEGEFSGYKRTAAERDKAVAEELKTAKAQVAGNTSQITSLKTAKADKSEVASIAQTALESKWLAAADRAKVAAVTAAAQTAQDKADTAKAAALTAADRAAQAKADAAKKAALSAASKDAADKADAAKAQAIADTAEKDAEVKKQAADDAKAKADKALADAKAYADGLNAAAEAKISRLEQTSVTVAQAEAIVQKTMSAKFQVPDTRNDNQPPSWYWENYPRQNVTEFKKASVLGLRGGVGNNAFCVMETSVPFTNPTGGQVFQTASLSDGTVWRRKSDVVYTHETSTYSRDAWTDWQQDETVGGAQAKADAVKKIAEETDRLARKAQADIERFQSTYANEKKAEAEDKKKLTAKLDKAAATVETTSKALTTLDGKVQAMHGIKTETIARGRKVFAGLTLGADGQTAESEVLVWADKFAVVEPTTQEVKPFFTVTKGKVALSGDLIADGTVQAKHIQTTTLSAISSNLGNVTAGNLSSVSINNGNGKFRVDAQGNLYAESGTFKGTVYADKIEGDVLKMYHLPQGRDGYTLHLGAVPFPRLLTFLSLQVTASGFVSQVVNEAGSHVVLVEISLNGQTMVRREVHPQYTGTSSEVFGEGRLIQRYAYVDNRANLVSSLALDSGREHDIRVTFSGGKTQPDEDIVCFVGRA